MDRNPTSYFRNSVSSTVYYICGNRLINHIVISRRGLIDKKMKNYKENLIMMVKRKLWSRGLRVKNVSHIKDIGYELLVNDKYRTRVVELEDEKTIVNHSDFDVLCVIYRSFTDDMLFFLKDKVTLDDLRVNDLYIFTEEDLKKHFIRNSKEIYGKRNN